MAALRIVCKRGLPATSLRLVAKEAKVPLSILHYYFKDKNELMQCVMQRLFEGMLRIFDSIRAAEPDPVKRIEPRLRGVEVIYAIVGIQSAAACTI